MSNLNLNLKTANAIIKLNSYFKDLKNFKEFPIILETVLKNYIPIDWLAMYQASHDIVQTVTTNKALPFSWNELYSKIEPYDSFKKATLKLSPGIALLGKEIYNPFIETDYFVLEYVKKHTDTVNFMTMPTIKAAQESIVFGCYNTDGKKAFTQTDKSFLEQLSPIIISASNIMLLYKQFDFQKVTFDHLRKAQSHNYIILDKNLKIIDFPTKTMNFLQEIFKNKNLTFLPKQISDWIDKTLPGIRFKSICEEPTTYKFNLKHGTFILYTYQIEKYFLMRFIFQKHCLVNKKTLPLTNMENKILKSLKKGLIVKEIADQFALSERGVNFHKYNIVKKLKAANIAEAISALADLGL